MKNNKGFTLVEMVVTIALMSIILMTVMQMFLFASKKYSEQQTKSYQMLLATSVEEIVKENVRYAQDVKVSDENFTSYSIMQCIDHEIYLNGSRILGGETAFNQNIDVVFYVVDDYSLGADIHIYQDDIETKYEMVCKLVNMELNSDELAPSVAGSKISYSFDK